MNFNKTINSIRGLGGSLLKNPYARNSAIGASIGGVGSYVGADPSQGNNRLASGLMGGVVGGLAGASLAHGSRRGPLGGGWPSRPPLMLQPGRKFIPQR